MITLESSPQEILDEMKRLCELFVLKKTMRYASERDHSVHSESVAEHLYGMYVLVDYFLPLEDTEGKLDRVRIHELILYHEIGEIETGDIISHLKTPEHHMIEREAAARVSGKIPERLSGRALERFHEFEDMTSEEAAFAVAIDKLEPIFEMLQEIAWPYYRKHKMSKDVAVGKKLEATQRYPYMKKFLEVWTDHMVSNNVFPE